MKFSIGLLHDKDIGEKIFHKGVAKSNKLLKDIFDLNFNDDVPDLEDFTLDYEKRVYKLSFHFKERYIKALLTYVPVDVDVIQDVLEIYEEDKTAYFKDLDVYDYYNAVETAIEILENKYKLNFTPLDPEERDINILDLKSNEPDLFEVAFTQDDYEGTYKASVDIKEGFFVLSVTHMIKNTIYLE